MKYEDPLSVYPCTKYLTFGPWIYMVPQYKPENVLMLGYAGGTTAGLIRLLYGDVPITGVDLNPLKDNKNLYGVNFIQMDARDYIKTCPKFDTVIIDMFPGNETELCGFITSKDFVQRITEIANYIIINTLKDPDMIAYAHLRKIGVNKPSGVANKIYYYETTRIPDLHPYK